MEDEEEREHGRVGTGRNVPMKMITTPPRFAKSSAARRHARLVGFESCSSR